MSSVPVDPPKGLDLHGITSIDPHEVFSERFETGDQVDIDTEQTDPDIDTDMIRPN